MSATTTGPLAALHRHAPRLALAGVVALAVAARLYGIASESLWLDETTSLMLARMDLAALTRWTSLDLHPPLYYVLLHTWVALWDGLLGSAAAESEVAIRGLSALAGVLNVLVLYALGRLLFGQRTGLLAALLLALSPYHIYYSQEVRMYAWLALWVSLSVWLALLAWRGDVVGAYSHTPLPGMARRGEMRAVGATHASPTGTPTASPLHWLPWHGKMQDVGARYIVPLRLLPWAGYVLVSIAALYTHYYALFALLVENLCFLVLLLRRRVGMRLFWTWLAAEVLVGLAFVPWLPHFLPLLGGGGGWVTMGLGKPTLADLAYTAVYYTVGSGRAMMSPWLRRAGYALFALALASGMWPREPRPAGGGVWPYAPTSGSPASSPLLFVFIYLFAPLAMAWGASQVLKPMYSVRYVLPFLMPFLLLVARGVQRLPAAWLRMLAVVALLAVLAVGDVAQVREVEKHAWRDWAADLVAQTRPGDVALFVPGWHARPFDYYAHGQVALERDVPVPVDLYREQVIPAVEKAIAGHTRVWLVWQTDHYTDPEGMVYQYLRAQWREVSQTELATFGRIILFARPAGGGS